MNIFLLYHLNKNLMIRKLDPTKTCLTSNGFYHISRIGVIRGFYSLLSALSEAHTFVLPVGEVIVTLEDVTHIFGLPINGEVVSGWIDSSREFLQSQSIAIFGRKPVVSSSSKSYIKLAWVYRIKDAKPFDTLDSI
ncbi:hypothetical protein Ahy_B01g055563 [Arachis hypogaea]|uniref:Aminotransferase-like plant mobile domain-containing protein n=1 Tax=Arachis hypogaea TaxID=3818 RepID=A0A445AWI5_ARAHY|nr:hypothetical protein Ahy_B01g055563 [Arachis hypogaea]